MIKAYLAAQIPHFDGDCSLGHLPHVETNLQQKTAEASRLTTGNTSRGNKSRGECRQEKQGSSAGFDPSDKQVVVCLCSVGKHGKASATHTFTRLPYY